MVTNNFSPKTRALFEWNGRKCWACGKYHADALHHIVGRGHKSDDCEASPLNACPIGNMTCHIGKALTGFETRVRFLTRNLEYLRSIGYTLTERDERFMRKYGRYYIEAAVRFAPTAKQE